MRWLGVASESTRAPRLLAAALILFALSGFRIAIVFYTLTCLWAVWQIVHALRQTYKKPLVMTRRAMRIFVVSWIPAVAATAVWISLYATSGKLADGFYVSAISLLVCCCICPGIVIVANWVLQPVEKSIGNRYIADAKRRLADMPSLKIVGITGSYGKTSTKHYLYAILSQHFDTLMTPGSYNTPMGVVRTVREMLKPYNEVFIVEMGAKQCGDIREICDIVHPQIGIVTAVGPQHLESFKTLQNVCNTKFELVDALPSDGLAVVNNDFAPIAERKVDNVKIERYGISNPQGCDYTASDIKYSSHGTSFTINGPDGYNLALRTALVGECNISNLLAAVAVARAMGVSDAEISYGVQQIKQVEHRLNIKDAGNGVTIIDDAFNSNPAGSRMALDVLASMRSDTGRRIVITPGMIELGAMQAELNTEFGRNIAKCADLAYIVGQYNQEAILQGIAEGGLPPEKVKTFDTFIEAYNYAIAHKQQGDVILIENDLPDTFK